jgi:hypothetical protein
MTNAAAARRCVPVTTAPDEPVFLVARIDSAEKICKVLGLEVVKRK